MFNRKQLKVDAKTHIKYNYWKCVVAGLILLIATGTFATSRVKINDLTIFASPNVSDYIGMGICIGVVAGVALSALLLNPLVVGGRRFFIKNAEDTKTELGELGYGFRNKYWDVVGTMLLTDIFLFLWTLLFVIPGVVKAYSYRMVPYILADDPTVSNMGAIDLSRKMMDGQKLNVFVMDLTFIGWKILSTLTFGLLDVFYLEPYFAQTNANLYLKLKESQSKDIA